MVITDITFQCLLSKLKLKQDSWFYSHPGHHSLGGISRCHGLHLSQVYAYHPFLISNFLHLYRHPTLMEYTFFARKAERWGKDMASLWGTLSICPHLNYLELLCHSSGELLSISGLKIWGDVQEPHNDMAYILVHTGDTMENQTYGVSLVWINPNQIQVLTMEEAVGTLSAYISMDPTGLMPLYSYTRALATHPSPRTSI